MQDVIPALLLTVAFFWALCGYLTSRGLLATWKYSLGYLLQWLHDHLSFHVNLRLTTVHLDFGYPFGVADGWVRSKLQEWNDGAEIEMGYCLHGLRELVLINAEAIEWVAKEVSQTIDGLIHIHLPKWAKGLVYAALPAALLAKLIAAAVAHLRPQLLRVVKVVEHAVPATATRVVRYVHDGAIALPKWVPRLRTSVKELERDATNLGKRVRRVEGIFAAGVAAAVIANALGIATKCLRGGNVSKAARSICGMDSNLLSSLLQDSLAIVGAISVVEFAEGLRAIEGDAIKILGAGIKEFPS